jgi:hypothetical protein
MHCGLEVQASARTGSEGVLQRAVSTKASLLGSADFRKRSGPQGEAAESLCDLLH